MIKGIIGFLKSLRFRIFITDIFLCGIVALVISFTASYAMREHSIEDKMKDGQQYLKELVFKLDRNSFIENRDASPEILSEILSAADILDGRIVLVDSKYHCVLDTYNMLTDKYFVSEEVISATKGDSSQFRDKTRKMLELTVPISSGSMLDKSTSGCILFYISISDEYENARELKLLLFTVVVALMGCAAFFALIHGAHLSKPIRKMTKNLNRITEGYVEENVSSTAYTELSDMADSVNGMLARLSSLEDSRQEFVSNVSHELKTPITSMKVLADSLLSDPDTPLEVYQDFMKDINNEIERENSIITDLLALVKLDRKNGDMHIADVSINEMLEILLRRLKPIAKQNDVELILESYRKVIAQVDEVKLALAMTNLIENGIKYNKNGGSVKIVLDCDYKYFNISVQDTGIGIPEDSLDLIFDRFYRVDKMRARQTGGTGLGLSITKSVVLMHHGTIHVFSSEGEGTTFELKIPLIYSQEVSE